MPNKQITMNWRNKRWSEGYHSVAVLDFEEKEDHTLLRLTQTGVPANFYENTEEGIVQFTSSHVRYIYKMKNEN